MGTLPAQSGCICMLVNLYDLPAKLYGFQPGIFSLKCIFFPPLHSERSTGGSQLRMEIAIIMSHGGPVSLTVGKEMDTRQRFL